MYLLFPRAPTDRAKNDGDSDAYLLIYKPLWMKIIHVIIQTTRFYIQFPSFCIFYFPHLFFHLFVVSKSSQKLALKHQKRQK